MPHSRSRQVLREVQNTNESPIGSPLKSAQSRLNVSANTLNSTTSEVLSDYESTSQSSFKKRKMPSDGDNGQESSGSTGDLPARLDDLNLRSFSDTQSEHSATGEDIVLNLPSSPWARVGKIRVSSHGKALGEVDERRLSQDLHTQIFNDSPGVYQNSNKRHYIILNNIKAGSFGKTHKVQHRETGHILCRKKIKLAKKGCDLPDVRNEVRFLEKMRHINCLTLFDLHINTKLEITIYTEFCPWSLEDLRTLRDDDERYRSKLPFTVVKESVFQMIQGFKYLKKFDRSHGKRIAHLDVKPDNIMINFHGYLKLVDFGMSMVLKDAEYVNDGLQRGTEEFMAPEVSQGGPYDERADVFSVGCCIYELVTGKLPKFKRKLFWKELAPKQLAIADLAPTNVQDLITVLQHVMEKDQYRRMSIEEMELCHLFESDFHKSREVLMEAMNAAQQKMHEYGLLKPSQTMEDYAPSSDEDVSDEEEESEGESSEAEESDEEEGSEEIESGESDEETESESEEEEEHSEYDLDTEDEMEEESDDIAVDTEDDDDHETSSTQPQQQQRQPGKNAARNRRRRERRKLARQRAKERGQH
eukprot:Clim_evm14s152 gene=Clim_evmTU14s152